MGVLFCSHLFVNMVEKLEIPEGFVPVTDDGQLIKKILKEGEGDNHPNTGAKVEVHYTGRLVKDGSKFDSSRDRGEKFNFTLGKGQVIKGWDQGVKTMKKGEQAIFQMSSDYGYGENGSGAKIPGGASLEFDIELFDWTSKEDITNGKKGILKEILSEGEGYKKPSDCTKVEIAYKCTCDGNVIEEYTNDAPLKFTVGEDEVNRGLEKAVQSMNVKEKSTFQVKPEWGYGENGCTEKNIPPNATLNYEIELLVMDKEKESWEMETPEKLEFAKTKKEQGNLMFKQGKYSIACKRYESGLNAIKYASEWEGKEEEEANTLIIALNSNIAMIKAKEKNWKDVITHADKVLEKQPDNIKALYRKGCALSESDDWVNAENILQKGLEIEPENKDFKRELAKLKKKIKIQNDKDKKMYQRMFK